MIAEHELRGGLEHRHLDRLALAGLLARVQRGRHRIGRVQRGQPVDERHRRVRRRRCAGLLHEPRDPGSALDEIVVRGLRRRRPALAEAAAGDVHDARVARGERRRSRGRAASSPPGGRSRSSRRRAARGGAGRRAPPAASRSSTTLRLPRLTCRKMWPMPGLRIGPIWRMPSPSGGSTLITSAPRPARICVANGPISTVVRSRILTPASGPVGVMSGRAGRG